ncbi:MAG: glycosyltransferase family 4 protein [Anaerolineae bacterium]
MNVLHINTSAYAGGAARAMARLHRGLITQGHTSRIVAKSGPPNDPEVYTVAGNAWPGRIVNALAVRADAWFGIPTGHRAPGATFNSNLFRQTDVIHLHNLHGRYFNYHRLPDMSARKPVVWTLHDMWAFTGHCAYSYNCERWQTGCFQCPLLRGKGRLRVEPQPTRLDRTRQIWRNKRALYRRAGLHITAPSRWLADLARQSILAGTGTIQHIPNGVDLNIFRPLDRDAARAELNIPPAANVIFFAAANITAYRKGFAHLPAALKALEPAGPTVLLTMGAVSESGPQAARFKQVNLGHLSDERKQCLAYNAADLFVFPTLADNQPLTVIESLACGTPVVAFKVGGVPEMVRHMQTGYLARPGDARDLAHGIQTLLHNDALRAQMRRRCRELAETTHDLNEQTRRHIALYRQAIKAHRRAGAGPQGEANG